MLWSLTPPQDAGLLELVAKESQQPFTYAAVGGTLTGERPAGYRFDSWSVDVGADDGGRFDRCAESVLTWGAQRGVGMRVVPDAPVASGTTFALVLPLPIGYAVATARVVDVVRTASELGFAYGTLPSHPEEGEEIFIVRRHDGRVRFDVSAFSRPRDSFARLGGPITRWLQRRANTGYLEAIQQVANRT